MCVNEMRNTSDSLKLENCARNIPLRKQKGYRVERMSVIRVSVREGIYPECIHNAYKAITKGQITQLKVGDEF